MNKKEHWKAIKSTLKNPQDLAEYLEVPIKTLYFLARSTASFYIKCEEPKSGGGIRVFLKPQGELKRIQKLIDRRILKHIPTHPIIHSYRKGRSQFTNAELHVGKPYVLKADRKDFFPTITPAKVDEVFRNLGFGNALARLLTSICTHEDQLPQGAPTSPAIANLIQVPLARRLDSLAKQHGVTCSIFGDDVYFSGPKRVNDLKNLVFRIIEDGGFALNQEKSKVLTSDEQQVVTGIVVNEKTNVSKSYRRAVRAIIHNCRTKGVASQFDVNPQKAKLSLKGKINHVKRLNRRHGEKLERQFNLIEWGV